MSTPTDDLAVPFVQAEAEFSPITKRALTRPNYAHRELLGVDADTWIELNRDALISRWLQTGDTSGADNGLDDKEEWQLFCICQYELECGQKEEFAREFGSNYDSEPRYR